MSMRFLLVGYAVILTFFVLGCFAIDRGAPGLKGMRRLQWAFSAAVAGAVLAQSRPLVPSFFSIVAAQLFFFSTFVLVHQAINDLLELNKRYVKVSIALGAVLCSGLLFFSSVHPSIFARICVVDVAAIIQIALTLNVIFRYTPEPLRTSIRATQWMITGFAALRILRFVFTILYPPQSDLLHLYGVQAYLVFANCMFGVGTGLSLIWLSLSSQRSHLQMLALTDGLTGLLNRRAFDEALQRELIYAQRHGSATALVLIDLDFFKKINDAHGHSAGDEVIRRVSATLRVGLRGSDAIARFGGEEFIMMLRDADLDQALMVAERVRERVESLDDLPGSVHVTASVGVAVSSPVDTSESLLRKADEALYCSKRSGRNTVKHHPQGSEDCFSAAKLEAVLNVRDYRDLNAGQSILR
jgi:diguanylate cyclase (GGDEF)-like protein